jgi:hypothetical protein
VSRVENWLPWHNLLRNGLLWAAFLAGCWPCQQGDGEVGSGVVGSDWMRREVSRNGSRERESGED